MHRIGGIFVAAFIFFTPFFALAGEKIEVTPAFQEVVLEAGQTLANEIRINNQTGADQELLVRAVSFSAIDTSGGVAFLGTDINNNNLPSADFIILESKNLTLPKGETKTFPFQIRDNSALAPGGHYAALIFQSLPVVDEKSSQKIAVRQIFSSLIFLEKKGGEKKELQLEDFEIKKILWKMPESLELHFQNTGNTHVTPRGILQIEDPFKRIVSQKALNEASSLLLPGQERVLLAPFGITALLPGKYTLRVSYRFDGTEDTITKEVSFFLFPYQVLIAAGLGALLLLLFTQRKKFFQRAR